MMPKSVEGISCEKMTKASTPDSKPLLADESQLLWRLKEPRNYRPSSGSAMGVASKMVESCMAELGYTRRRRMGVWGLYESCCLGLFVIGDGADKRMLGLGVVWALGFRSWVTVSVLRGKGRALAQLCSTVRIMCFRDGQVYSRVYTFFCGACLPLVRCTVQARVTGLCPLVPALP
jgi:hypothetical protein